MSKARDDKTGKGKPAQLKRQLATDSLKIFTFKASDNPYDYANIQAHVRSRADRNYMIVRMGDHLQFHKRDENPVITTKVTSPRIRDRMKVFQTGQILADSIGWKLHISVHPLDIEAAWPIIRSILLTHNLSGFKIIHPDILKKALITGNTTKIDNKQFTIYQFRNADTKPEQWENIIKEIEVALQHAQIRSANTIPKANKEIEGSRYFTYRNDSDPKQSSYISDQDAETYVQRSSDKTLSAHNLTKADDPYKDVKPFTRISFEL